MKHNKEKFYQAVKYIKLKSNIKNIPLALLLAECNHTVKYKRPISGVSFIIDNNNISFKYPIKDKEFISEYLSKSDIEELNNIIKILDNKEIDPVRLLSEDKLNLFENYEVL